MADKVQKVERDFEFIRDGESIKLLLRAMSEGRRTTYVLATAALVFIGLLSLVVGFIGIGDGTAVLLPVSVAAFLGIWFVNRWASKRTEKVVVIDQKGVRMNGNLYPFEDIDGIGWEFGGDRSATRSETTAALQDMAA